ncbi:MAG: prolyl oligopeptidase family serine peptidase [Verrucomicrobiales bacterium]
MKTLFHTFRQLVAFLCLTLPLAARTWTSSDGRTLEADFVSATETSVTLKKAGGKPFTLELAKLSAEDQEFVKEQAAAGAKPAPGKTEEKPAGPATAIAGPYAEHLKGEWSQFEGKGGLQGMLFGGKDLDAKTKYPLVIYLHGKGNDVLSKAALGFANACSKEENYKERPCLIYAPQCPDENGWQGATGVNLMKTLKDLIKNLPVDEDRLYVIGYSMGGYGTFALLNDNPRMFAAGIPIAGGAQVGVAKNLRRIPVWIWHGEKDDVVPPDQSRAIAKALERVKTAKYTEVPGGTHGIGGEVEKNAEVHKWLFEQKRGK